MVALLVDLALLDNKVGNLMVDGSGQSGLPGERSQQSQLAVHFQFFLPDGVDEVADAVDVIPEEHTREERDEDDKEGLEEIARMQIAETNCEDDSSAKVVTPDVLLIPGIVLHSCYSQPPRLWTNSPHQNQNAGKDMAHQQVEA
jgi:hypothetical protein